jgi:zinc protease
VTPYINENEEGIEGSSSVRDFETFLQLVNLYLTQPRKDESLFKSMVTKEKSMVQFIKSNPQAFYQDTLMKIVYNNNPWVSVIPTEEEYNNLNLDTTMSIYKQVFGNADGMHFTFVGNIDMAKVRPLLETYLGSLPATPADHLYKDNNIRPVKGVVEANIKKGKEEKALITMLWTGETAYNREENMAFQALLEVLNISIIEKLREELGGMYSGGLRGSIVKRPYVHYTVSASIPTGPENVDKLTNALLDIIKKAQQKGVDQKDLDKVKETWKKHYRTQLQENSYWLNGLSQAFIDKVDPENMLDYEQRVDRLTVADLQKAAQKFLTMDNYVKAVLYPENANVPGGVKKTF